jgi:hypothetical protein
MIITTEAHWQAEDPDVHSALNATKIGNLSKPEVRDGNRLPISEAG